MDAYQYLKEMENGTLISEDQFYKAIKEFQRAILEKEDYEGRLQRHRVPEEVNNDVLQKLYTYDNAIQQRPELQHIDNNNYTFVTSVITQLWKADKYLKTLYRTAQHYCEKENKDFNTIAIHVAEFRATVRLEAKIRRQIRIIRSARLAAGKGYTFDDWLNHHFFGEHSNTGQPVANDSEQYLTLVKAGKMSAEVFDKIQNAQQHAYDYMITSSLRIREQKLLEQHKDFSDRKTAIDAELERLGKFFNSNLTVYNEVLARRKHQAIKWGAKFLLPEHYQKAVEKLTLDVNDLDDSTFILLINNNKTTLSKADQLMYIMMDVELQWLTTLHGHKSKMHFEQMISSPDFRALIDKYGERDKLMEIYRNGLEFAPDREIYINELIRQYESTMPNYQSGITIRDWTTNQELNIQTGEYRRIGYAWVNGGYNANNSELRSTSLGHLSLCPPHVPLIQRYSIYVQILYQLAAGGGIAFHLAFLRKELKNSSDNTPAVVATVKAEPEQAGKWLGGEEKRQILFEALVEESFIEHTADNQHRFMNNQPVKWLLDGRSLFYMLLELRTKKYKCFAVYESLVQLVKDNFVDKNGAPFKNVSQNTSGMTTSNLNARPRRAGAIDQVLKRLEEVLNT
jgi:hypothetical protein